MSFRPLGMITSLIVLATGWFVLAYYHTTIAAGFFALLFLGAGIGRLVSGTIYGWVCGAIVGMIWGAIGVILGGIAVDVLWRTPLFTLEGWAGFGLIGLIFGGFQGGRIARRVSRRAPEATRRRISDRRVKVNSEIVEDPPIS